MTVVLGTPILALERSVAKALLISDLHVPEGGGAVVEALQRVLLAARHEHAELFVLGDLFDSYVSRGQVGHGCWRDVALAFAAAVAEGVPITMLHGNRDFLLGDEFVAASGVQLAAGGVRVRLGGVDTLLLHGDELCLNDLPYQRAKRWLRSAPVRWLARNLPVRVALAAAARARAKSRRVIAGGDQSRFLPTMAALEAVMASGVGRLVFGHIHQHCHGRHGAFDYWVLPAFDRDTIGLLVGADGVRPVQFPVGGGLAPVAVPGPCSFARSGAG